MRKFLKGGYTAFDCKGADILNSKGVSLPGLHAKIGEAASYEKPLVLVNCYVGGGVSAGVFPEILGEDASGNYLLSVMGTQITVATSGTVTGAGPVITEQPTSTTVAAVGDTFTFALKATGTGLVYQWQYYAEATSRWTTTTIPGNKTDTVTAEATETRISVKYRCQIKDIYDSVIYSNEVMVTIEE